jgi:hypothetical protein
MGYDGHIQVFDWKKSIETKLMTLVVRVCQECPLTSELTLLKLPVASIMSDILTKGSVLKNLKTKG